MIETTIERLGHLGDGIAPGPLYVPRALPGEVVQGVPEGKALRDVKILAPSPDRVRPGCRHYGACGGCQVQHVSDDFVATWKTGIIRDALGAHGLVPTIRPIATSPERSRRRATFSARRTKKGAMAGFHARASDTIVEIPDCRLLSPGLMDALPAVEALAAAGASRKGEIAVVATLSEAGLDLAVSGGKPLDGPLRVDLAQVVARFGIARLTWTGEPVATVLPPVQLFGRAEVVPPAGTFLQATTHGEETLAAAVAEAVGNARRVADLFSGCGTFALRLAETARVHAVEGDAKMVGALDAGWRRAQGLKQVTTETRDLFRQPMTREELSAFDAVVIDPPRAGAAAQARELAVSGVPRIAYVSCNPVTFAQDVAVLCSAGYVIDWVQPVDQFRWSTHVELAASLRLDHMPGDPT
jgi:23S rRNA (uracil1939-C5)-methyltransferase